METGGGAGNPAPPAIGGGYATDYLWLKVWSKISMLDILQHFLHHEKTGKRRTKALGKLIFPRFHQLDAVRTLINEASNDGAGEITWSNIRQVLENPIPSPGSRIA